MKKKSLTASYHSTNQQPKSCTMILLLNVDLSANKLSHKQLVPVLAKIIEIRTCFRVCIADSWSFKLRRQLTKKSVYTTDDWTPNFNNSIIASESLPDEITQPQTICLSCKFEIHNIIQHWTTKQMEKLEGESRWPNV